MTYPYLCGCGVKEDRNVSWEERDRQTCECGERMVRVPHFGSVAVHIPVHMRAMGDDMIRQIMPGEQEAAEEGKDVREVRKEWLKSAVEVGAGGGRYRHDLE